MSNQQSLPAPRSTGQAGAISNRRSTAIPFVKMVGTGNDFLIVESSPGRFASLTRRWPAIARAVCDRRQGIGADGLLLLEPSRLGDARMRVFNPDGSEAQMCGNGARCVVRYLAARPRRRNSTVVLETAGGMVRGWVRPPRRKDFQAGRGGERVHLQMAEPTQVRLGLEIPVGGRTLSAASVDTGVPHLVVGVSDLGAVDVHGLGRQLRAHRLFQPRGTNVDFVEVDRRASHRLRIRTYERGVEGETLACGTGVAAAAVIHALTHHGVSDGRGTRRRRVDVITRGGDRLSLSFRLVTQGAQRVVNDVVLEGPVRWICHGAFSWPLR